jgi:hypothetical protein
MVLVDFEIMRLLTNTEGDSLKNFLSAMRNLINDSGDIGCVALSLARKFNLSANVSASASVKLFNE